MTAQTVGPAIVIVKARRVPIPPAEVRSILRAAALVPEVTARLPGPDWSLTIRVSGDRELRRLNRRFLGEDHVTDVLSFPSGDGGSYLGDIVISWPVTQRQAGAYGHAPAAELALLCVHGLLHLLGWDHQTAREDNVMRRLTVTALDLAGYPIAPGRLRSRAG